MQTDLLVSFFLAALFVASTAIAQPAIPALGKRDIAYVASTTDFTFYSDFWMNLHDYLYGTAGGGPFERSGFAREDDAGCLSVLAEQEKLSWEAAETYYQEQMGERHHRTDPLMRAIRYRLTNLAASFNADPQLEEVFGLLQAAAPAYLTCFWPVHDARNRRWIGGVVSLLAQYGHTLRASLSELYQAPWPENYMIDVVSYSDYAGANTASGPSDPSHTKISSTQPEMAGIRGLEMVLHEASHLIFGFRWGAVTESIIAASDSLNVDPPRNLWHALSFYTSGEEVARIAGPDESTGFVPYAKRTGMFEGPYRGYLEPIERYWGPYLQGKVELPEAVRNLVETIISGDE